MCMYLFRHTHTRSTQHTRLLQTNQLAKSLTTFDWRCLLLSVSRFCFFSAEICHLGTLFVFSLLILKFYKICKLIIFSSFFASVEWGVCDIISMRSTHHIPGRVQHYCEVHARKSNVRHIKLLLSKTNKRRKNRRSSWCPWNAVLKFDIIREMCTSRFMGTKSTTSKITDGGIKFEEEKNPCRSFRL